MTDIADQSPGSATTLSALRRYATAGCDLARSFVAGGALVRASALAFTSLLSLVPFLAFAFAVLKGLGVQNVIEPLVLDQVAAGSREVVARIVSFINNTRVTKLGVFGLLGVVVTALRLLADVEDAFNNIWRVRETRSFIRRLSDYVAMMVLGPLLLLTAVSITSSLQSQFVVRWLMEREVVGDVVPLFFHLVPYLSIWIVLLIMYMVLPNARVRFTSALLGAVLAGTVWQLAQWGYVHFQVGVSRYNAIYGTIAVLPVLMVWIYISWVIVLFGTEVVYAHQHRNSLGCGRIPPLTPAAAEVSALAVAIAVFRAFEEGAPPPAMAELAAAARIPLGAAQELLELLRSGGMICEVRKETGERGYLPTRPSDRVRLLDLVDLVAGSAHPLAADPPLPQLQELKGVRRGCTEAAVKDLTVRDLLGEFLPRGA
ncbi:MAG TPA: YihY/virulence factor BrkB family protein [Verrucomicrobiae bacterium]|nr:YihY/virulence factor BrkB family protein [Verrucomicrobiae bacterium]